MRYLQFQTKASLIVQAVLNSAALFFMLFSSAISASYLEDITVSVSMPSSKIDMTESVLINVQFSNNSNKYVSFLTWGTPFEGRINKNMFLVQHNGVSLPYTGRTYKRGTPMASDYITLAPAEVISATVDLRQGYDLSTTGRYSVSYRTNQLSKSSTGIASNTVNFNLSGDSAMSTYKRTPNFASCSSGEKTTLNTALTNAESISKTAWDDLKNAPIASRSNAARYKEWFGVYSASRYSTVTTNFQKIYSAANAQTIAFDCSCTELAYAYVYINYPYEIYLCSAFWSAPKTGTDSQAGTLVHELSHFTVVAGTDDIVYGQIDARSLAILYPSSAIQNADSHEYFAENTPSSSMPVSPPTSNTNINIAPILALLLLGS